MQRIPVESTDIVSIGYDAKARILEIEFKENRIYRYFDVAPEVYEGFMRADSYGEFFYGLISKHYRYERVQETKQAHSADLIAFVSGNSRKVRDLKAACEPFGIVVEQLDLPVDEIQSHDPAKIASQKAKQAYKLAGRAVVVNDTSWNILALRGFPGGYMSYVADWLKAEDFLALLSNKKDRTIISTDTLVYYDGKRSKAFSRDVMGMIIDEPRGEGISIDRIMMIAGQDKTVAELEATEGRSSIAIKDSIWHDFAKWYNLQRRIAKAG